MFQQFMHMGTQLRTKLQGMLRKLQKLMNTTMLMNLMIEDTGMESLMSMVRDSQLQHITITLRDFLQEHIRQNQINNKKEPTLITNTTNTHHPDSTNNLDISTKE